MTTKLSAAFFAVFVFLAQPGFLFGQQTADKSDWASVQSLAAGDRIAIETKDGKRLKGAVSSASATDLNLTASGTAQAIDRNNIRKVYRLSEGGSRAKWALIGAGAGAGVGGGGAAVAIGTNGSDKAAGYLGAGIAIGAAVGAVLGYLSGKGTKRTLIYESR